MNTQGLDSTSAASYYEGPDLVPLVMRALEDAGLDPEALDIDDLAGLDEFHALGRAATVALADLAGVRQDERVLDVGAGIGGPARLLAARRGAHVTALDVTPRFCRLSDALTRGTGLQDRIDIVEGDALSLPFDDGTFDLVWTQAVSQNVADKARMLGEMARVVRPGGRVAMFEIAAGPGGALCFPVPWADDEASSYLVSPAQLRAHVEQAGLAVEIYREGGDVVAAIAQAATAVRLGAAARRVGLGLVMPDFEERMAALGANVAAQAIVLVQLVARRPC